MADPFSLRLVRYLPRNLLSRLFGKIARLESPAFVKQRLIQFWITQFRVDITEAELPPEAYPSLLAFFTRKLKDGARLIDADPTTIVSPVDGMLGQFGKIESDRLLQAKGMEYSLAALLGDEAAAKPFLGGTYLTVYLSPRDYHRIHAPFGGTIPRSLYEPGTLWPVNAAAVHSIPSLFAVNERVTVWFETARGPIALVCVGATNVGSIRLAYHDYTTNCGGKRETLTHSPPLPIAKGDHVATFELGSTIVLLLPPNFKLDTMWGSTPVKMGRRIGAFT